MGSTRMNKIIALILAFSSAFAFAAADDVIFQQRNSTDTATVPKLPPHPTSGYGLMAYDGTALVIQYLQVGTSLSVSGGVIDVVPGGAPAFSSITGKPTTLAGYGITDAYPLTGNPSGFLTGISGAQVNAALGYTAYDAANPAGYITSTALSPYATSASVSAGLAGKFSNPTGTTAQYIRGDGSLATFPTVAARSFSYTTRSLNTCFQISSTRDALVTYSVDIATSLSLTSGQQGTVYLETFTDSACSTGTQEVTRFVNGQTGTLTIGLALQQNVTGTLTGVIPAGAYVRLRTQNNTGTPTFTARPGQETLL